MQFSIISLVAALAATAAAQYGNGTSAIVPSGTAAPSGTGPYGTGVPIPSSTGTPEFPGAANKVAGSAFAIVVAGGVAMMM
jgi:hypothetical protein